MRIPLRASSLACALAALLACGDTDASGPGETPPPPPPAGIDLLYDARPAAGGAPSLYRLDLDDPAAAPWRILPQPGAWDVAASPDGTRIAYAGVTSTGPAIFVARADGTGITRLTSGGGGADQPAWSADGTRLAFRRWEAGAGPGPANPADVWIMNADGSEARNLTGDADDAGSASAPTWSPVLVDNSQLVAWSHQLLADGRLVGRIHVMRPDGSGKRAVTTSAGVLDDEPAWAPDGRTIAFARRGGAAAGLRLVTPSGQERALLAAPLAGEQRSPAWSPDGAAVAFTSSHEAGEGSGWQLYTVRADGTGLVRRTSDATDKLRPAWIRAPAASR